MEKNRRDKDKERKKSKNRVGVTRGMRKKETGE